MMKMSNIIVQMRGIDKKFSGVQALKNSSFELYSGEVHALVGENGAGKSTLMKILGGIYAKDAGTITINGEQVEIKNVQHSQELGIRIVHQEPNLMSHLTVAENIFIGDESRKKIKCFLDKAEQNKRAEEILNMLELKISPDKKVAELTIALQQMVEIAKAIPSQAKILVLDEPTAALANTEIETLFRIIRKFREQGVGIVYISHRMDELKQICDRITVMRDGQYIATSKMKDITIEEIINQMVGRTFDAATVRSKGDTENNETVLEVKNLNRGKMVRDVSFALKKGEILGFAGLMGAGRTEVARAIFGADKKDSGEIHVKGQQVKIDSPSDAVKCGIAYLSEDRKRYGLALGLSVKRNIALTINERLIKLAGFIDSKKEEKIAKEQVALLKIKTPGVTQLVQNLSGGNQQKVIVAKWLECNSDIMIFDEPTRGIDVGAKAEIYNILEELKNKGKSIIMISSELPEILRMSDRVAVMCNGRITGVIPGREATQENIMHLATKMS